MSKITINRNHVLLSVSQSLLSWPAALTAAACVLAAAILALWVALRRRRTSKNSRTRDLLPGYTEAKNQSEVVSPITENRPVSLSTGKLHHVGGRPSQQDSIGLVNLRGGLLAAVADGMGGLSDGDKVSQKIVYTIMQDSVSFSAGQLSGNLIQIVSHVNAEVNQMLGDAGQYTSGSTLIALLAEPHQFQWVSVGDSRLYLFRGGGLLQMNREHIYEAELLELAANRELSFQEARSHAKKKSITSFIGMGELKHIDEPIAPVRALRGDKLLVATDGVFNTLSDEEIADVLSMNADPAEAAVRMESMILERGNPHQDNFSAILIFYR